MYAKYNHLTGTPQYAGNYLSDIASILSAPVGYAPANLTSRWAMIPSAYVILNGTTTVAWAKARTGINCAVGQRVGGDGIPNGATIATITDGVGFTMSAAALVSNAQAIISLCAYGNLPAMQLGCTARAASTGWTIVAGTGVFTKAAHGFVGGEKILLAFTGTNNGYTTATEYYVKYINASTFYLAATYNGANITGYTTGTMTAIQGTQPNFGGVALLNGSTTVSSSNINARLVAGMTVSGYGIQAGTTIVTVTATAPANIVLSLPATVDEGDAVIFIGAATGAICDTANTEIFTGIAGGGWELYDQMINWPTDKYIVMRAPMYDDGLTYKYMQLDLATAGYLTMNLYENFNNITHGAVNAATAIPSAHQQRVDPLVASTMIVSASARFCAMLCTKGTVGALTYGNWNGIFERTRLAPWDTVAAGYHPTCIMSSYVFGRTFGLASDFNLCNATRIKDNLGGVDKVTTNAFVFPSLQGYSCEKLSSGVTWGVSATGDGNGVARVINQKVSDGAGGYYTPLNEIQVRCAQYAFEGGSISALCDVWNTVVYPNNLDETTKGGVTYALWQNTSQANTTASATQGGNSAYTAFPKG